MGEYYSWVNIDKQEYLCPRDFGLGNKLYESAFAGNQLLGALYDLLDSDWKGDAIIFLGDESDITEDEVNPVLQRLHAARSAWGEPGYEMDYVFETYRCISGLFTAAEPVVRQEIEWSLKTGEFKKDFPDLDRQSPYDGLFVRAPKFCRYTVNHSRREFFDIEKTRLTYTDEAGVLTTRINPLPLLMAFPGSTDACTSLWIGGQIEVTDTRPPSGYTDQSSSCGWDK